MVHYATVHACRRKQLLNYFGETYPPDPVNPVHPVENPLPCCDICQGEVESMDATTDAQIVMSAIARTGQRFGINHIVSVVTGDASDRIRQLGHDRIKTFGAGKDQDKRHWRLMIDNLLAQGLVEQTSGGYPVLKLQPESREVLFGGREVHILKSRPKAARRPMRRAGKETGGLARLNGRSPLGGYNEELFDQLRDLRKELASEQGVPPYVIFTDRTLHEMARRKPFGQAGGQARFFSTRLGAPTPTAVGALGGPARLLAEQSGACGGPATVEELLEVTGVGQAKLERYGQRFFDVIRAFWANHPDAEDNSPDETPDVATPSRIPDPASRTGAHIPTYVEEAREKHARAYAKWSDEEDESLRQAWTDLADSPESDAAKIRTIADDFDRKPGAIRSRLRKLGLLDAADDVDLRTK